MSFQDFSNFESDVSSDVTSAAASPYNPLNMVTNARGMLDTLTNKFILKPANAQGIAGFIFDYEGETQVTVDAEISDHYTEQNTYINDQAAQRPQRITLRGFVGELVSNPNVGVLGALNVLQSKLSTLPAILGKYTPAITQKIAAGVTTAINTVNKIDNVISRAQNALAFFTGASGAPTKQQSAYRKLYTLWSNNTVFTLNTPFNYFTSVMIEHMVFIQPEETKEWSEIAVTVKEVRFLQQPAGPGVSAAISYQNLAGRAAPQGQAPSQQGNIAGVQQDITSFDFKAFGHQQGPSVGSFT